MASPRKTQPGFLAGLLRESLPVELLEPLAWELGYRDPRRTAPALAKHIAEQLPLESAAATIRGWAPLPRAVARFVFARLAPSLAERDAGQAALAGLRGLSAPAYAGPTLAQPADTLPVLSGGVLLSGEQVTLSAPPTLVLRGTAAQVDAGRLRAHLEALVLSAGELRAHRLAVETFRAGLSEAPRLPMAVDAQTWVQRAWRAATRHGYRVGQPPAETRAALSRVAGANPAACLAELFEIWASELTAEAPATFDLFGPAAWRLTSACDQPAPPVVHRIMGLAAFESLPVERWVELPRFIDHLHREGLLPPTCRAIQRTFADPRVIPVSSLRPDHNEGEPFRLRVPYLLRLLLGAPCQLGLLDVALAPPGESVIRFSGPRARVAPFEAPYREVTHLRRTSLGAAWLDPLATVTEQIGLDVAVGPGVDGLDTLADLLG